MRIPSHSHPFRVVVLVGIAVGLGACSPASTSDTNLRPTCVTLEAYSSVIQQVMSLYPSWSPLEATPYGYSTSWAVETEEGSHRLTTTMTRNGCICATMATSYFPSGSPAAEFAGYLQGAAVAPLSNLDYTTTWLQPKILLSCPLAFLLRGEYVSSENLEDGTFWKLECRRQSSQGFADLEYSFAVATDTCQASVQ